MGDRTSKHRLVDRSSVSSHRVSDDEEPVVVSIEEKIASFNKVVNLLNYS